MTKKLLFSFYLGLTVVMLLLICCSCGTAKQTEAELELGTVANSYSLAEDFKSFTTDYIKSKESLISVLKDADYSKSNEAFGESEAVYITFYDKSKNKTASVCYAVEYETENMYAIYNDQIYKVENADNLLSEIGKFLSKDKYSLFERSLEFEKEVLEDSSIVYETAVCRTKRFFCNNESENESLRFPEETISVDNVNLVLDKYSVSKIAADTVNIKQYRARPYYDEYTDMWIVNVMDEAQYQRSIKEAEESNGELICYDVSWDVVIDNTGKVLYYMNTGDGCYA